jgi:biotin carboxyl carrier protein
MKIYKFKINDEKYKTRILEYKGDNIRVEVNGIEYKVELESESKITAPQLVRSEKTKPDVSSAIKIDRAPGSKSVKAPIPGLVHSILVKAGDEIVKGQPVIILEAMKMESEISSAAAGTIKKILVKEGETVQEGQILIEIGE